MSIKATVDGTAYNGITTINAGGKAITLAETGTIATPTATKEQSITANGTISVDVTNFKTITITTNVSSSSGDSSDSGGSSGDSTAAEITVTGLNCTATLTGKVVSLSNATKTFYGATIDNAAKIEFTAGLQIGWVGALLSDGSVRAYSVTEGGSGISIEGFTFASDGTTAQKLANLGIIDSNEETASVELNNGTATVTIGERTVSFDAVKIAWIVSQARNQTLTATIIQ